MLTPEQQLTLKAYVEADQVLNALPHTSDGAFAIAYQLSLPTDPAFTVWKSSVSQDEIMRNGMDWTRVDNLSVGKARIWEWMFNNVDKSFNPSKANVRAGIEACWAGAGAELVAVRASIYGHCKRTANALEKLFATGTGTDATPATTIVDGTLSYNEVAQAMGWNV